MSTLNILILSCIVIVFSLVLAIETTVVNYIKYKTFKKSLEEEKQ